MAVLSLVILLWPAAWADVPPGPRTPGDVSPLPVLAQAPSFHLRSLEGPGVRNRDLRGKLVLLAFACASCADEPEEVAATFVRLQRALKTRGLFGRKVVLAFVVRHPERESRTGFRAYASGLGVDPYGWVILSGSPETTARLRDQFGRFGVADGQPPADTRHRVFLVDSSGRVRRVYSGEAFQADAVLADIEGLL
jgi:protein SCO1/2